MTEVNGWHLPGQDRYFVPFCEGELPKQNGFQRDHLLKAFEYVKKWDIAIDVGAYVGFWTLDMAQRFKQVFAFEPAADSFECLSKNMAEFPHVSTVRAAIGKRSGQCAMMDDPQRMAIGKNVNTGSRFVNEKGKGIPMLALDELRFKACDLLKIDVEGYETEVLLGAQKLIRRFKPVIIMETDKNFAKRFGHSKFSSEILVREMGYEESAHLRPDKIFVPGV